MYKIGQGFILGFKNQLNKISMYNSLNLIL